MPDPFLPDELALLAGIHADPADDLPRLVYADWLEERGDAARAEFIRLQCDTARRCGDPAACEYTPRERSLAARHGARWRRGRLRSGGRMGASGCLHFTRFHRGLPDADYYTSNYLLDAPTSEEHLAEVGPHLQLMALYNVYLTAGALDPVPPLSLPILARAQRVHVRALAPPLSGDALSPEAPLPHRVVVAAVAAFRPRKMLHVRFGPLTAESLAYVRAELSPHVPTTVPAAPC